MSNQEVVALFVFIASLGQGSTSQVQYLPPRKRICFPWTRIHISGTVSTSQVEDLFSLDKDPFPRYSIYIPGIYSIYIPDTVSTTKMNIITKFQVSIFKNDEVRVGGGRGKLALCNG